MFQFKRDLFRRYGFRIYLTVIPFFLVFFCCIVFLLAIAFIRDY